VPIFWRRPPGRRWKIGGTAMSLRRWERPVNWAVREIETRIPARGCGQYPATSRRGARGGCPSSLREPVDPDPEASRDAIVTGGGDRFNGLRERRDSDASRARSAPGRLARTQHIRDTRQNRPSPCPYRFTGIAVRMRSWGRQATSRRPNDGSRPSRRFRRRKGTAGTMPVNGTAFEVGELADKKKAHAGDHPARASFH